MRRIRDKYWWWNVNELQDMLAMIVLEGAENLRLEFHPKQKGEELVLIDRRTGEPCGSYNRAHECPIDCE